MIYFLRLAEQSKPTLFRAQSVFEAVPEPFGFTNQFTYTSYNRNGLQRSIQQNYFGLHNNNRDELQSSFHTTHISQ